MTAADAGRTPLVLVMVGTDHHPFARLVDWSDAWLRQHRESGGAPVRVLVQYGRTHAPSVAEGRDFIPRTELDDLLAEADVVVCHGGPSTVVETRRRGLVPLVVARSSALGEHVDDHQQRFARLMAARGVIRLHDQPEPLFHDVADALVTPLRVPEDDPELPDPAVAALRLGALVDELIARPPARRGLLRRLLDRLPRRS